MAQRPETSLRSRPSSEPERAGLVPKLPAPHGGRGIDRLYEDSTASAPSLESSAAAMAQPGR